MPRLSRTQKFADLREQLSNDKETNLETQDLSGYQNRLNSFQSDLGNVQQNINNNYNQQSINNGYQEAPMSFASQQPINDAFASYQEVPINDDNPFSVSPAYKNYQNVNPTNNINNNFGQAPSFNNSINVNNAPSFNQPAFEQPINQQIQNDNPFVQQETKVETLVQKEVKPQPQSQASSFFGDFMNGFNNSNNSSNDDFNSYFESNNNYSSIDEVFSDVSDDSGEMVSQKERDTYLNQAINDATRYGENNSQQTIDSIINDSVDEVRHTDNRANSFDVLSGNIDDEEFSNTVSMEITKIMDEVSAPKVNEPVVNSEPVYIDETPAQQPQINKVIVEEKPEEVVEIKNISEMTSEPVNTMSNTIPFVVAEDDEEVLDDEEDGSNTVLNIILIVLIVVLVAVLGLIVFYILKTKGIF